MKKILVGGMAVLMCLSLAGCSNNKTENAINNLSNELDQLTNTVSSFSTIEKKDYTLNDNFLSNLSSKDNNLNYLRLNSNTQNAQNNLNRQEVLKQNLINKTSKIKNNLSKNIKLSSNKLSALKELTNNISKYNTTINMTKNEYNNTLRNLKSLKKSYLKNTDQMSAKLNRLSCNTNTRNCYYENLLNTLNQIEELLDITSESSCPNGNCYDTQNYNNNTIYNNDNCQNGICYENYNKNINNNNYTNPNYYSNNYNNPNISNNPTNSNNFNRINNTNNRINNNYNNRYNNRFNPNRNTDTYGPSVNNIDTYRFNPNNTNNNNLYNQPVTKMNEDEKDTTSKQEDVVKAENDNKIKDFSNIKQISKENRKNLLNKEKEEALEKATSNVESKKEELQNSTLQNSSNKENKTTLTINNFDTNKNIEKLVKGMIEKAV